MEQEELLVFWFRRDLRLADNRGLAAALDSGLRVLPIFIFDTEILDQLENKADRRVSYIQQALLHIQQQLRDYASDIMVYQDKPLAVFKELTKKYRLKAVYCNADYEPYAIKRDQEIADYLAGEAVAFSSHKDQVLFEKDEILKADGKPYTVYTPYSRRWKAKLEERDYQPQNGDWTRLKEFAPQDAKSIPSLEELGFLPTGMEFAEPVINADTLSGYEELRNFPAQDASSRLGIALRFGTISVRKCVTMALQYSGIWLNQLIWREFFMQILYHFPQVQTQCFKPAYEGIQWRNNEAEFALWCAGKTGYPLVDAGMRELNEAGFMHNRVRMLVASFLTKHLLIDWRWGEAYFAEKLLDYELAANNGNWQWAAGCGCDAAPYFRIFNPSEQVRKFDPDLIYVKRWCPDFESLAMQPIVEHKAARERALSTYKKGLNRA